MDSNFNKLRKQFDEQPDSIPEVLNWENMEAGIDLKMEALKSNASISSKKRTFTYLGIIGLLLLIPFVCTQNSDDASMPLAQEVVQDSKLSVEKSAESPYPNTQNSNSNQSSKENSNTAVIESEVKNLNGVESLSKSSNNPEVNTTQNEKNEDKGVAYKKREYILYDKNTNAHSSDPKNVNQLNGGFMSEIASTKTDALAPTQDEKPNIPLRNAVKNKNQYILSSIESIASIKSGFPKISNRSIKILMLFDQFKNESISHPISNQISVLGGVNIWNMGYGSDVPEREEYETNLISFSTQINYKHTLKNKYIVMTGLHYQRLESRFNRTETVTDYPVLLTDVVLEVQSSLISGSSREIRGDVTLEVEAERIVQHYNSIQLIQLPFALGKSWNFGNVSLDMYLGSSLNIIWSNSGKTLFEGEIIEYSNDNNSLFSNSGKLNGLIGTRLAIPITTKLGITSGFQWQRSFSDWSKTNSVKINPQIMNWEFGLVYSL
ncbi:MAG: hypothetical protein P1U56_20295 [Saprospiraceae bacterium]|nr:hypothetical protein [Saprospiraceae bacterium]